MMGLNIKTFLPASWLSPVSPELWKWWQTLRGLEGSRRALMLIGEAGAISRADESAWHSLSTPRRGTEGIPSISRQLRPHRLKTEVHQFHLVPVRTFLAAHIPSTSEAVLGGHRPQEPLHEGSLAAGCVPLLSSDHHTCSPGCFLLSSYLVLPPSWSTAPRLACDSSGVPWHLAAWGTMPP